LLLTICFVSTTTDSMICVVNWIPPNTHVRFEANLTDLGDDPLDELRWARNASQVRSPFKNSKLSLLEFRTQHSPLSASAGEPI